MSATKYQTLSDLDTDYEENLDWLVVIREFKGNLCNKANFEAMETLIRATGSKGIDWIKIEPYSPVYGYCHVLAINPNNKEGLGLLEEHHHDIENNNVIDADIYDNLLFEEHGKHEYNEDCCYCEMEMDEHEKEHKDTLAIEFCRFCQWELNDLNIDNGEITKLDHTTQPDEVAIFNIKGLVSICPDPGPYPHADEMVAIVPLPYMKGAEALEQEVKRQLLEY